MRRIRPTEDVDCVVKIVDKRRHSVFEEKLRALGFSHCTEDGAPICRWLYNGVKVDVMPNDPAVLGFANRWYDEGFSSTVQMRLPDGTVINVFSLPIFIATKIEAYHGRGEKDYRFSHDIEDVITVLDGQINFDRFSQAPAAVATFLKSQFNAFLMDPLFIESVATHIEFGYQSPGRVERLIGFMTNYSRNSAIED